MTDFESFKAKFGVDDLAFYRNEAWTLSIRPHQPTLGASVLSLNRPSKSLALLSAEESVLLTETIRHFEERVARAFSPDKINYLCLMMFDPFVHYHVLPRYENAISQFGRNWEDSNWPAIPPLLGDHEDIQVLKKLHSALS